MLSGGEINAWRPDLRHYLNYPSQSLLGAGPMPKPFAHLLRERTSELQSIPIYLLSFAFIGLY